MKKKNEVIAPSQPGIKCGLYVCVIVQLYIVVHVAWANSGPASAGQTFYPAYVRSTLNVLVRPMVTAGIRVAAEEELEHCR